MPHLGVIHRHTGLLGSTAEVCRNGSRLFQRLVAGLATLGQQDHMAAGDIPGMEPNVVLACVAVGQLVIFPVISAAKHRQAALHFSAVCWKLCVGRYPLAAPPVMDCWQNWRDFPARPVPLERP